jgi:hypothetical protein
LRYRGIDYVKVRGYWRARPGHGTGERDPTLRPKRQTKRQPHEPTSFWECVNESNGRHCPIKHKGRQACSRHARELNRRAWHVGGRKAQTWTPFKVVDGVGYHYGVGAPK